MTQSEYAEEPASFTGPATSYILVDTGERKGGGHG